MMVMVTRMMTMVVVMATMMMMVMTMMTMMMMMTMTMGGSVLLHRFSVRGDEPWPQKNI